MSESTHRHRAAKAPRPSVGGARRGSQRHSSVLRFFTSARTRAVLGLGVVLGLGATNTMAYWTDTGTVNTGTIQAGTLDLRIDGALVGQNGSYTKSALAMSDMLPGESIAVTLQVQNPASSGGTNYATFNYLASAYATGGLASYLTWTVVPGATAGASTTANGLRTQSCSTTTGATWNDTAFSSSSGSPSSIISTKRNLASNASENVCVRATLPAGTDTGAMGQSATATMTFTGSQVGAP